MSDASPPIPPLSAGTLLREARRAQGLHIAALAAAIKVTPQKLELLETDRFEELPDATFARALAQAVCRQLKIDPVPVLARLPQNAQERLDRLGGGLNAPFRERPGRIDPDERSIFTRPGFLLPLLLVLAALAVLLLPFDFRFGADEPAAAEGTVTQPLMPPAEGVASGAETPAPVVPPVDAPLVPPVMSSPGETAAPGEPAAEAAPSGPGVLSITVGRQPSWVQLTDADGRTLIARELKAGESLEIEGVLPMRLTVGNAAGTSVRLRGQPIDLMASTRGDNVARLQVQ